MTSLAQKMESVRVPRDANGRVQTDQRDRVPVYILKDKKWIWRTPIDAREIVALGIGTFTPDVAVAGNAPSPQDLKTHETEADLDADKDPDVDGDGPTATAAAGKGPRGKPEMR